VRAIFITNNPFDEKEETSIIATVAKQIITQALGYFKRIFIFRAKTRKKTEIDIKYGVEDGNVI